MKKTCTFLASLLLSTAIFAQTVSTEQNSVSGRPNFPNHPNQVNESKLLITSIGATKLRVMIDGNKLKSTTGSVKINNLSAGNHAVLIYKMTAGNNYGSNNNYKLVYSGNIYVKQRYFIDLVISRSNKSYLDEQPILNNFYDEDEDDDDWNTNTGYWNNPYNTAPVLQPMNGVDFVKFQQKVKDAFFENDQLAIIKQTFAANYLSTVQVMETAKLFRYDTPILQVLKAGYPNTIDKRNYSNLSDLLSFNSSKDDFARFLRLSS